MSERATERPKYQTYKGALQTAKAVANTLKSNLNKRHMIKKNFLGLLVEQIGSRDFIPHVHL